ncbi:hypothetical protein LS482_00635 [Sinomicrobium kalidii]|uniref:hypothetical protein n=1 Tax=Sinomicrobium kalidii TaxID=2900738 RepID=UPI001E5062A3|nr:hypothetical protein [Sinomicrobium kalidii]UGU16389.1 hypothetical protein LS482_00635 [Sinomicrobium kalidii]
MSLCENEGTTVVPNTSYYLSAEGIFFLKKRLGSLTPKQSQWIDDNVDGWVYKLYYFLDANEFSEEFKKYVKKVIDALMTEQALVSISPLIKYPKGSDYATRYPKLTEYLKNQLPKVANISRIVYAINHFTKLPISEIKRDLQWGSGPTLVIMQLDNYRETSSPDTAGLFDKNNPDNIYLDVDFVEQLENKTTDQMKEDALLFFLGSTILHEYVHYGDYYNGFEYPGEEGIQFEYAVYGRNIEPEKAYEILMNKK